MPAFHQMFKRRNEKPDEQIFSWLHVLSIHGVAALLRNDKLPELPVPERAFRKSKPVFQGLIALAIVIDGAIYSRK